MILHHAVEDILRAKIYSLPEINSGKIFVPNLGAGFSL
jgi:hypothetical protein